MVHNRQRSGESQNSKVVMPPKRRLVKPSKFDTNHSNGLKTGWPKAKRRCFGSSANQKTKNKRWYDFTEHFSTSINNMDVSFFEI